MKNDVHVQKALEPWTPEFLREKQSEDTDLLQIQQWIENDSKPHWDNIRGESPTLKAYYQQWEFLILKNGVLYRRFEQINKQEVPD